MITIGQLAKPARGDGPRRTPLSSLLSGAANVAGVSYQSGWTTSGSCPTKSCRP